MKLTTLHEGLIKLPQRLLEQAWEWTLSETLKWVAASLELTADSSSEEQELAFSVLDKAAPSGTAVDDFPAGFHKRGAVERTFMFEVPSSYAAKILKQSSSYDPGGKVGSELVTHLSGLALKFKVALADRPAGVGPRDLGIYYPRKRLVLMNPTAANITAEFLVHLVRATDTPAQAQRAWGNYISEYKATFEHELTHAVQSLVLEKLHPSQNASSFDDQLDYASKLDDDADVRVRYFLSPNEFDPWVKTSIARLRAILTAPQLTKKEKRELVDTFISADLTPKQAARTPETAQDRQYFFTVLRAHDQERWKRAVKLLLTSLEEELTAIRLGSKRSP